MAELDRHPAHKLTWYTRSKSAARRYGSPVEEHQVEGQVVMDLGREGMLVLHKSEGEPEDM